jgi:ribosomal protein S14
MTQPAATTDRDARVPVPAAPASAEPATACQVCGTPAAAPKDSIFCRVCGEPVIVCGWAP